MHWTNVREWCPNRETSGQNKLPLSYGAHCCLKLKRVWKRWESGTYLPLKVSSLVDASSCSNSPCQDRSCTSCYRPPVLARSLLSQDDSFTNYAPIYDEALISMFISSHTHTQKKKCYWRRIKHNKTESLNLLTEEASHPPLPCSEEHVNCLRYQEELTPSC